MVGILLIISTSIVFAACGGEYSSGDWDVTSSVSCSDETITLDGNLSIHDGGNLIFDNITLEVNGNTDGIYGINVLSGGNLSVQNSNITNGNTVAAEFFFIVYDGSNFNMSSSYLSECGWSGTQGKRGLEINTNDSYVNANNFTNNFDGIYIYSDKNTISGNNVTHNNGKCIILDDAHNNTISNNTIGYCNEGIHLIASNENIIFNNTITKCDEGLQLEYSNNTLILYNTLIGPNVVQGIWISSSKNNNIIRNTIIDNTNIPGIQLDSNSYNNLIYDNSVINNDVGIYLDSSYENMIFGNNLSLNLVAGIKLSSSYNNSIHNNTLTHEVDAISLTSCDNNTLNNNEIDNSSRAVFLRDSDNNYITDSNITNGRSYDIYLRGTGDNIFLNSTFNKSSIEFYAGSTGSITVKWYLDLYVNDTLGNNMSSTNVSLWDVTTNLIFSELTDSTGWINKKNITEYVESISGKTYHTNYTINVTKIGYDTDSSSLNITKSIIKIVTLSDTTAPTLSLSLSDSSIKKSGSILISCSATDSQSGISSNSLTITKPSGESVSHNCNSYFTDTISTGTYTVTYSATDIDGNYATRSTTFSVTSSTDYGGVLL